MQSPWQQGPPEVARLVRDLCSVGVGQDDQGSPGERGNQRSTVWSPCSQLPTVQGPGKLRVSNSGPRRTQAPVFSTSGYFQKKE